jgi:SHS2 domain-containing protein
MPYLYLPDIATADVAFEAWGNTREEMFCAAADALTNVMVDDLASVAPVEEVTISLENEELDLLLFSFLQELIFLKDARCLLLRVPRITLTETEGALHLEAIARGERIDNERHPMVVDVKAVTLHLFSVWLQENDWWARVVLDI